MPTELDGYQNILGDYLVWLNDKLNIDRRAWLDDAHCGTHQIPTHPSIRAYQRREFLTGTTQNIQESSQLSLAKGNMHA